MGSRRAPEWTSTVSAFITREASVSGTDPGRHRAAAGCPVCGRPGSADQAYRCPECGWILRSPLRAGPVTAQVREEFTLLLRDAQHALDLRIAALAWPDPRPYHRYIRGGTPDEAQWAAARQAAFAGLGNVADEALLRARLTEIADGLRTDTRAAVVEVGRDGIAVCRAGLDRAGAPLLDHTPVITWASLLPMLSADEDERHFQLAGGLGHLDRTEIRNRLGACLAAIPGGNLLVVCRPAGWPVLEWASAAILVARPEARFLRLPWTAGSVAAGTVLAGLTTEAPLRDAYRLMVATVENVSGKVRTEARQIFSPGDVPGTECSLALRRPPGDGKDTTLAIFSDGGSPDEPIALYSLPLPEERVFELHMVLDGPGRVRIADPPGATAHPATWARVHAEIPDQVLVTLGPADLVCAVDLCGPRPEVRERLRLVRMLLGILEEEYPAQGSLRVSVLTCTDHDFERGRADRTVVQGIRLSPVVDALAWLARQEPANVTYAPAAPIEDLLHEASIMLEGSRPGGRAARLLIVGGRRPHPHRQDTERIVPCPHRYKWRESLSRLTGPAGARCVAVTDAKPASPAQAAIWESLGPAGLRWLSDATSRLVGEDLALLVRHAQQIPIPLPNPE